MGQVTFTPVKVYANKAMSNPAGWEFLLIPRRLAGTTVSAYFIYWIKQLKSPGPQGTADPTPGIEERQTKGFFWLLVWPFLGQHTAATRGQNTGAALVGVVGLFKSWKSKQIGQPMFLVPFSAND